MDQEIYAEIDRIKENMEQAYSVASDFGAPMPTSLDSDNLAKTFANIQAMLKTELPLDADLNNYKDMGVYYQRNNNHACVNCPDDIYGAFVLEVILGQPANTGNTVGATAVQRLTQYGGGHADILLKTWIRSSHTVDGELVFGDWHLIPNDEYAWCKGIIGLTDDLNDYRKEGVYFCLSNDTNDIKNLPVSLFDNGTSRFGVFTLEVLNAGTNGTAGSSRTSYLQPAMQRITRYGHGHRNRAGNVWYRYSAAADNEGTAIIWGEWKSDIQVHELVETETQRCDLNIHLDPGIYEYHYNPRLTGKVVGGPEGLTDYGGAFHLQVLSGNPEIQILVQNGYGVQNRERMWIRSTHGGQFTDMKWTKVFTQDTNTSPYEFNAVCATPTRYAVNTDDDIHNALKTELDLMHARNQGYRIFRIHANVQGLGLFGGDWICTLMSHADNLSAICEAQSLGLRYTTCAHSNCYSCRTSDAGTTWTDWFDYSYELNIHSLSTEGITDLDDCVDNHVYTCTSNTAAAALANSPTTKAFYMRTFSRGNDVNIRIQVLFDYGGGGIYTRMYMRSWNGTAWNGWTRMFSTVDPPNYTDIPALFYDGVETSTAYIKSSDDLDEWIRKCCAKTPAHKFSKFRFAGDGAWAPPILYGNSPGITVEIYNVNGSVYWIRCTTDNAMNGDTVPTVAYRRYGTKGFSKWLTIGNTLETANTVNFSGTGAKVQEFIDAIPDVINRNYVLTVTDSSTTNNLSISNKCGPGSITVKRTSASIVSGYVEPATFKQVNIANCSCKVAITNLSIGTGGIYVDDSSQVEITGCTCNGSTCGLNFENSIAKVYTISLLNCNMGISIASHSRVSIISYTKMTNNTSCGTVAFGGILYTAFSPSVISSSGFSIIGGTFTMGGTVV